MKKFGRPTEEPKTNVTILRLTDRENEMLLYCQDKTNLTKSEILRLGIEKIYNETKESEAAKK